MIVAAMMTSPAARHLVIAFPIAPVSAVAMTGAVAYAQIIAPIPASHAIPKHVSVRGHANLTVLVRSVAQTDVVVCVRPVAILENRVMNRMGNAKPYVFPIALEKTAGMMGVVAHAVLAPVQQSTARPMDNASMIVPEYNAALLRMPGMTAVAVLGRRSIVFPVNV